MKGLLLGCVAIALLGAAITAITINVIDAQMAILRSSITHRKTELAELAKTIGDVDKPSRELQALEQRALDERLEERRALSEASSSLPPYLPLIVEGNARRADVAVFAERLRNKYPRVDDLSAPSNAPRPPFKVRIWRTLEP